MAITAVVALGRAGVWRIKNIDLQSPDSYVFDKVNKVPVLQPEEDGDYILIEFTAGKECN